MLLINYYKLFSNIVSENLRQAHTESVHIQILKNLTASHNLHSMHVGLLIILADMMVLSATNKTEVLSALHMAQIVCRLHLDLADVGCPCVTHPVGCRTAQTQSCKGCGRRHWDLRSQRRAAACLGPVCCTGPEGPAASPWTGTPVLDDSTPKGGGEEECKMQD